MSINQSHESCQSQLAEVRDYIRKEKEWGRYNWKAVISVFFYSFLVAKEYIYFNFTYKTQIYSIESIKYSCPPVNSTEVFGFEIDEFIGPDISKLFDIAIPIPNSDYKIKCSRPPHTTVLKCLINFEPDKSEKGIPLGSSNSTLRLCGPTRGVVDEFSSSFLMAAQAMVYIFWLFFGLIMIIKELKIDGNFNIKLIYFF
jgi:hypothetical protein